MILRRSTNWMVGRAQRQAAWPRRAVLVAPALTMLLTCACGGSGSSGFDGALDDESDAIELATLEGSCVEFKQTTYCASGVPLVIGDETAVVDFEQESGPVPCAPQSGEPGCTGEVGFEPGGFPETAVFLGAWAESENGPWTLSSVTQSPGGGEASGDVVVILPDDGAATSPLVIAVLVYFDGVPDDLPEVARRLRDFGPDVVYVDDAVEVEPELLTVD